MPYIGGHSGENNPHVLKEEDLENNPSGNSSVDNINSGGGRADNASVSGGSLPEDDIYNSDSEVKKKFSRKDFFGFFKLPLIIIVFLIAAGLVLKYIFSGKPSAVVKKTMKNNTVITDKKRFSPSVFDYSAKPEAKSYKGKGGTQKSGKFNIKFKKETDKLNRNIKFNSDVNSLSAPASAVPQITKKTVVFIEASYEKHILDAESGIKKAGRNKNYAFKPAGNEGKSGAAQDGGNSAIAVPQGAVIDAYTKYKIFSYNISVPVIAAASSSYYFNGKAVFRKGDKFFGTVSVKHSLNRLNINFDKIIERSGNSLSIDAIAMMPDGSGGVKGDVHNHYAGNILTSIAQGIVGAASIFTGGGSGINSSNPYTFQNQVRENIAQNELNSAQNGLNNYGESNQNISITLPAGAPIKIIFLKPIYVNRIEPQIK